MINFESKVCNHRVNLTHGRHSKKVAKGEGEATTDRSPNYLRRKVELDH